ncbi:FtsW/RodA/SpoVE family cell cycle protein [Patescibacteria group bacterium]|nr:FtsW/RodA/SpoVE family cell cycle protein [Patescibacteria group bacterium]
MFKIGFSKKNISADVRNYIMVITFFLLILSCVLVYDVSSISSFNTFDNPYHFTFSQIIWVILAVILFIITQKINVDILKKFAHYFYIFAFILAVFTIIPTPFKKEVLGASRWIVLNPHEIFPKVFMLGEITIQPSELLKLSLCFIFSITLTSKKFESSPKKVLSILLFYSFITSTIFLLQPSFKDIAINLCMAFFSIFFWGFSLKGILKILIPIVIIASLLVVISGYRFDRIRTFIGDGTSSASYHQNQLKIAVGSGGIFGLGFGKSIQKHEYVPEAETDSIFAIFSEEFGFFGSSILLLIFYIYFSLIYKSIFLLKDPFEKFFALNVLVWYGVQSFLNLGSITGVIPLTGVPLPLISYGGSSIIFFTIAIGILCNMLKNNNKLGIKRYNF